MLPEVDRDAAPFDPDAGRLLADGVRAGNGADRDARQRLGVTQGDTLAPLRYSQMDGCLVSKTTWSYTR